MLRYYICYVHPPHTCHCNSLSRRLFQRADGGHQKATRVITYILFSFCFLDLEIFLEGNKKFGETIKWVFFVHMEAHGVMRRTVTHVVITYSSVCPTLCCMC